MIKKLPAIITVTEASNAVPDGLETVPEISNEQNKISQALDSITGLEHRVKYVIKGNVWQGIVNLDSPRDDALVLKTNHVAKKELLNDYYLPFHKKLQAACNDESIKIGIDCHMIDDLEKKKTGVISLSNNGDEAGGKTFLGGALTCPTEVLRDLLDITTALFSRYPRPVRLNIPIKKSYIIQQYSNEQLPWIRLNFTRSLLLGSMEQLSGEYLSQLQDQLQRMMTYLFKVEDWMITDE